MTLRRWLTIILLLLPGLGLILGLVAAFLFINVIASHGILNQAMQALCLWDEPRPLQNDSNAIGILILQVWKNMPFALLLLTGAVLVLNHLNGLGLVMQGAWPAPCPSSRHVTLMRPYT